MLCSMMEGVYCAHEPIQAMSSWKDMIPFLQREALQLGEPLLEVRALRLAARELLLGLRAEL